jgi:beta-lactamase regulating signal transducer with metallopeptidase domain
MTVILATASLVSEPVVERLGWALVHSLWQFALVALLAGAFVRTLRRRSAATRYGVLVVAMAVLLTAPVATWVLQPDNAADRSPGRPALVLDGATSQVMDASPLASNSNMPSDQDTVAPTPAQQKSHAVLEAPRASMPPPHANSHPTPTWRERATLALRPWLAWMVVGWGLGVVVCSLRPLLGWHMLWRLRRRGVSAASAEVLGAMARVSRRLGLRRAVHVLQSTLARVPVVIGYVRPVVLLPLRLVTSIPTAQLDAILAHELAHVRRHDFAINLLQMLVETIFFYHPAVWWLSWRLRVEREHCCDDIVVRELGNRVEYGRALLAIEEQRGQNAILALGAADGSLLSRVRRIVAVRPECNAGSLVGRGPAALFGLICLGAAVALSMNWNVAAKEERGLKDPPAIDSFGPESNGLRCRLVAVPTTVDDASPDITKSAKSFAHEDDVTLAVELKNVSERPLTLLGVRHGNGQPGALGKLFPELFAPHLFELEFTDADGRPVPRSSRAFFGMYHLLAGASAHEIAPGMSLVVVLRPARFHAPMDHRLPPGSYRAKVRYRGPSEKTLGHLREVLPDKPHVKAWSKEVTSSEVAFTVAEDASAPKPAKLLWGPVKDGLQAAVELRLPLGIAPGNDPPGALPTKAFVSTIFHVKNVSDHTITFVSETARQGDEVTATNEAGETKRLQGAFFTGEPILVRWTLKPGEVAELHALTAGIGLIDAPGKYTLRYRVNFSSLSRNDGKGELGFPKKDDWQQVLVAGDLPLTIRARTADDDARERSGPAPTPPAAPKSPDEQGPSPSAALPTDTSAPPKGLELLAPYPKLHELSLDMTERQFLAIADRQKLKWRKAADGGRTNYFVPTGDGHTVIVMFGNGDGKCSGIQRVRGEDLPDRAHADRVALTPADIFSRKVSMTANEVPLKDALVAVARAAEIELQLEAAALKEVGLDVEKPVTMTIKDEPLDEALGTLINWEKYPGALRMIRSGKLIITTLQAYQAEIERHLPKWLKVHYNHGLVASLDDDHNVVSITAGEAMSDQLLGKLKTLPKLRELHIETTKLITPAGLKGLAELPSLQKLTVFSLSHDGKGLGDTILQSIVGLESLRELHVHQCGTTDAGARLLEAMPQLTLLDVSAEPRMTDAAIASVAKLKRLKSLSLNSYVGTEDGWMRFSAGALRSLTGLRDLEHLHLVGQPISPEVLAFPRLQSLSLGTASVDDTCTDRIAECRQLQALDLVYTQITDLGLRKIADLPDLRRLNLDSYVVTDSGIEHLTRLPKLQHISLRASRLTDEALQHLARIKTLTRIDLHGSGEPGVKAGKCFTIAGVERLKALPNLRTLWLTNVEAAGGYLGLKELTQLRELSLMMTDIREEELDALEAALPHTRIHHATGGGFSRVRNRK